jgi:hypothetical protein
MEGRILQLVPAAAGWRTFYAFLGNVSDDLESQPDDALYGTTPIACFALIEEADFAQRIVAVYPEDWPSYLHVCEHEQPNELTYLGPGETVTPELREAAIDAIKAHHKKMATKLAEAEA